MRLPSLLPCSMELTLWALAHHALLPAAAAPQTAGQQPPSLLGPCWALAQLAQQAAAPPCTPRTALPHQPGRPSQLLPHSGLRGAQASRLPAPSQLPRLHPAVVQQGAIAAVAALQAAAAGSATLVAAAAPATAVAPAAAGAARGGCFRTSIARSSTAGKQPLRTSHHPVRATSERSPEQSRSLLYRSFNSMLCPITLEPFEDPVWSVCFCLITDLHGASPASAGPDLTPECWAYCSDHCHGVHPRLLTHAHLLRDLARRWWRQTAASTSVQQSSSGCIGEAALLGPSAVLQMAALYCPVHVPLSRGSANVHSRP